MSGSVPAKTPAWGWTDRHEERQQAPWIRSRWICEKAFVSHTQAFLTRCSKIKTAGLGALPLPDRFVTLYSAQRSVKLLANDPRASNASYRTVCRLQSAACSVPAETRRYVQASILYLDKIFNDNGSSDKFCSTCNNFISVCVACGALPFCSQVPCCSEPLQQRLNCGLHVHRLFCRLEARDDIAFAIDNKLREVPFHRIT